MFLNPKFLFVLNFGLSVVNAALFFHFGGGWYAFWTFMCGAGAIMAACLIAEDR